MNVKTILLLFFICIIWQTQERNKARIKIMITFRIKV